MTDENKARIEWAWRPGWTPEERRREVAALVERCAEKAKRERPPSLLADLLEPPDMAGMLAAGVHPARVVVVGATHRLLTERLRTAFLSFASADDRVDAQPWLEACATSAPRERLFLEAIASALFGWLS